MGRGADTKHHASAGRRGEHADRFDMLLGAGRGVKRPGATTTVVNSAAREFTVRIVEPGEPYGNSAINDGQRLVAIYDKTHAGPKVSPWGQQTGVWPLKTVLAHAPGTGWTLYGGVPEWTLDAKAVDKILDFLRYI